MEHHKESIYVHWDWNKDIMIIEEKDFSYQSALQ